MRPAAVLQSFSTIFPLFPSQKLISVTMRARGDSRTLGGLENRASRASLHHLLDRLLDTRYNA